MSEPTRLTQRMIRVLIALAVLAAGVAALALNLAPSDTSAKVNPLAADPVPALYADRDLPLIDRLTAPQAKRATNAAARYLTAHPVADDPAFANWALATVAPPPTGAAQQRELAELHRIGAARTPAGIRAATWLEAHGKKDVWKSYVKQYGEQTSKPAAARAKALFKKTYRLAKVVVNAGKAKFARPSPYITDPTLHAVNQRRFAKKFSYPSKHALVAAAMVALLSHLEPHRAAEYRWMADEIDFSRLYAGGHYPSDIAASAYLGTLVADYELAHAA